MIATMLLGIVIFVDDYFNCLTVGTVMKPLIDRNKISREKLAYVIDSTAAPICIIAPISSWAAAVSSSLPEDSTIDGFKLFIKTISSNYYSWFSIAMVFLTIILEVDFEEMKKYETTAENGTYRYPEEISKGHNIEILKGKVMDLLLPVLGIIILSIVSMLYTEELFRGKSISEAFANCDAIMGLAMGAVYTVIFIAMLYLPRKIVTPRQFMDGLVQGFINMVPTILILTFAWTLSGICGKDYLNAGGYVSGMVQKYSIGLTIMPAVFL